MATLQRLTNRGHPAAPMPPRRAIIGHNRSFDNGRRIVDNSRWLEHVPNKQNYRFLICGI
jgi:hypothetical protein